MRGLLSQALIVLSCTVPMRAQPTAGYPVQLFLNDGIQPGAGQTLTGGGAPVGPGIWVELWRVPSGSAAAGSVASVRAVDGLFSFEGVDVAEGDSYHVTLSRSWNFDTDLDAEGWDAVANDVTLDVSGGTLNVTIDGPDPQFFNESTEFDSSLYRVVEVRLVNPAPPAFQDPPRNYLSVFWGDFVSSVNYHFAEIPSESTDFETIAMPMNVDEVRAVPGPEEVGLDGLWATGMRDVLRIDPLDPADPAAMGMVLRIDSIRIREDYRLEFDHANDPSGIGAVNDIASVTIDDGFLSFVVADGSEVDPSLAFDLAAGRFESQYFTRFAIGLQAPAVAEPSNSVSLLFNDDDSGAEYVDDGGTPQVAQFPLLFSERQDAAFEVDLYTTPQGEWTEDGRVPVAGLQVDIPDVAASGDVVRIDYVGLIPASPYGPSPRVVVAPPSVNNPPIAVIVTVPHPPFVALKNGLAGILLNGSYSYDGDEGTQPLTYFWDKLAGPPGDYIVGSDQETALVLFTRCGFYLYRLTVDDGQPVDSSDTAVVFVIVFGGYFAHGDDGHHG